MPSAPQPTPHAQQPPQQNVAVLDGVLGRVTFSNRETGYTIARIAPDRGTGRGPVSADTERIKAGLAYTLSEAADDGHCYLPEHLLIADAAKILGVPENLITPQIPDLAAEELAVRDELPVLSAAGAGQLQAVYLPRFYHSERSLAASLSRLLSSRADRLAAFQAVDWEKALGWLKTKTSADLAPEQADAVKLALTRFSGQAGIAVAVTVP